MLLPLLLPVLMLQTAVPSTERAAVEKPIQAYFRYHQTGDPKGLSEAFHPEALLQWSEGGQRKTLAQVDWIKRAEAQAAKTASKARPEVRCQIASVEITGNAAVAKLILDYPTFRFIDYLHLLKLDGEWKIVDKIYHREEGKH
ncbi:MAG: nuclear transport factor 2 family protein [Holophaga sp.]|nr:nuclear transport factor 2 family protein [Holophaga sp.]